MAAPLPFPVSLAELVGLFLESILFGVFLVSFFVCLNVLLFSGRRTETFSDRMILGVVLLMGFISIWDIALFFRRIIEAFVNQTGPPAKVFGDLAHWSTVVRGFNYGAQTLLGDSILIYRCYKVYFNKLALIAFPILIWLGILVCVIAACFIESQLGPGSNLTGKDLSPWGTGFISLTLSLNIIVTTMIAWRIQATYSNSVGTGTTVGNSGVRRVLLTIIESGAIYSTALIILLGVFVAKSNGNIPMSDAMVQIIPIVFNVILIRVHQGRTSDNASKNSANTIVFTKRTPHGSTTRVHGDDVAPMPFTKSGVDDSYSMDNMHGKSNPTYHHSV